MMIVVLKQNNFQSQLINAFLKMIGKKTGTRHSGICMPNLLTASMNITDDTEKNLETWFSDNFIFNDDSRVLTLKGLLPYYSDGIVQVTVAKFSMQFNTVLSDSEISILEIAIKQAFVSKLNIDSGLCDVKIIKITRRRHLLQSKYEAILKV